MSVLLGPIIGKTTATSVRILLEVDNNCDVNILLNSEKKNDESFNKNEKFEAYRPKAIEFRNLKPKTVYKIEINGVKNTMNGSFHTYDGDAQEFRVACAACDKGPSKKRRGPINLFEKMYKEYVEAGRLDLVIRHGDQVYADNAFNECLKILNGKIQKEKWNDCVEAYRKIYRDTWGQKYVRLLMANVPHLMIWDDHELVNDWGTKSIHKNTESIERFIGGCARHAYWEYQRQLWDSYPHEYTVDELLSPLPEYHFHRWGHFGLVIIDTRGSRSFNYEEKEDDGRYLGMAQLNAVKEALSTNGEFGDRVCKSVLVVHSNPLVYLGKGASSCLACIEPQRDKMGFGLYPDEQVDYIKTLTKWRDEIEGRCIHVICGDIHHAMRTVVRNEKGEDVLQQTVTTAISNTPPPSIVNCCLSTFCMGWCCNNLADNYKFEHTEKIYERNFALIKCVSDNNKWKQEVFIVTANTPDYKLF